MSDPTAIAEAGKMQLDLNPLSRQELQTLLRDYEQLSPELTERIKSIANASKADK